MLTYRPAWGAVTDPFALANAPVLAGASSLALPVARPLTAAATEGEDAQQPDRGSNRFKCFAA